LSSFIELHFGIAILYAQPKKPKAYEDGVGLSKKKKKNKKKKKKCKGNN
jgi:hypothetical protein